MEKRRSSLSALVAAMGAFFVLLSVAGSASAKPEIIVKEVLGYCTGPFREFSTVSVRLDNASFGAWYPDLWYHFNAINMAQPNTNPAIFQIPPGTYSVVVNTMREYNGGVVHSVVVPDCVKRSSFLVDKTVINSSPIPTSSFAFPVEVSCDKEAFRTTVVLDSSNGFEKFVTNVAVDSICHIAEHPNIPVPGCYWKTTYPDGQSIRVTKIPTRRGIPIQNELICPPPCPNGLIEQDFPGSNIKFCCDHKLEPGTIKFCCRRAFTPVPTEGQVITPAENVTRP